MIAEDIFYRLSKSKFRSSFRLKGRDQAQCTANPEFMFVGSTTDFAFCKLDEPVDLPLTPVVYGCEFEMFVQPGLSLPIVGFGHAANGGTFGMVQTATVQEMPSTEVLTGQTF